MRQFQGQRQPVRVLAFAADGRHLAAGDGMSGLAIYDAGGGRQAFTALAFHPSGRSLLLGCYDGTARLDDAASGREMRSVGAACDVSPTGRAFTNVPRSVILTTYPGALRPH